MGLTPLASGIFATAPAASALLAAGRSPPKHAIVNCICCGDTEVWSSTDLMLASRSSVGRAAINSALTSAGNFPRIKPRVSLSRSQNEASISEMRPEDIATEPKSAEISLLGLLGPSQPPINDRSRAIVVKGK